MNKNINWSKVLKGKVYSYSELKTEAKEGRVQRLYLRVERELKVEDVLSHRVNEGEDKAITFTTKDGQKYTESLDVSEALNDTVDLDEATDTTGIVRDTDIVRDVDKKRKPSVRRSKHDRRN